MRSIFWFRQDLRINDNKGLYKAINNSTSLLGLVIIDENIIKSLGKKSKRLDFYLKSVKRLKERLLDMGLSLCIVYGDPIKKVPELIEKYNISLLWANRVYDIYGTSRDSQIANKIDINFNQVDDYLLLHPSEVKFYKTYSRYYKKRKSNIPEYFDTVKIEKTINSIKFSESFNLDEFISDKELDFEPGDAEQRLKDFDFGSYSKSKDKINQKGTSRLSFYIRFGLLSIRKVYNRAKEKGAEEYIKELAWRGFYYQLIYYHPEYIKLELQENRRDIDRENNKKYFDNFCNAQTGYPIVDAGIIQLKSTGWLHNRLRMVLASFLTKDLLIDWRRGEQFFAKHLIDYDKIVNTGNWQWASSVGADFGYVRVFSPIRQSEKYDSKAKFIKSYIPGLKNESLEAIHNPLKYELDYYKPIVDHYKRSKKAKEIIKN